MVELVDTQVSGICARKGVGVRVPPFALYILGFFLMFSTSCNCGRSSEGERGPEKYTNVSLQEKTADRANAITAEALDILEKHTKKQKINNLYPHFRYSLLEFINVVEFLQA